MPRLKAILFDYGHTLVDMHVWHEHIAALGQRVEAIAERSLPDDPAERTAVIERALRFAGDAYDNSYLDGQIDEQLLIELHRAAFIEAGYPLDERQLEAVVDAEHEICGEKFVVGEGVPELLEMLRSEDIRLGIVSNNIYLLEKASALFPLLSHTDAHFDTIVFSSDVGKRKPHPSIYRAAIRDLGVTPSEIAFVGDRLREDVQGPKRQGIARAFLTHEYRQEADPAGAADAILQRLPDLPAHLELEKAPSR